MNKRLLAYVAVVGIITACQSRSNGSGQGQSATASSAVTATRPDTSGGMGGMAGMSGGMMSDTGANTMMGSMRAEMMRMNAMNPDQMKSMMASHRQMAGNMLAQMNSDMRSMNMAGDPAWTALVDSVRQDLVRMPDVSGPQLKTLMSAHQGRMERLMTMHRDMMSRTSVPKK
jgi:hypothetical protein